MRRRRAPSQPRPGARRWHIPPPLVHGPDPLEGGAVLREVPGALGLVLWQAARDVLLWAQSPPANRGEIFAAGAAEARRHALQAAAPEPPLLPALQALQALLAAPGKAAPPAMAGACHAVAAWAEEHGALATALAFEQCAALVEPDRPAHALAVARLASRLGDHSRAELWFRRSTGIARRARDWRHYARSFSGLGTLYQDRGNLPAAQRFHLRALRGARRGGLRAERAVALHDLFGVSVEAGRTQEAERYAREAFAAYPARSPRLAALAHDVAYFWMEQGDFARALSLFEAVAPLVERPTERLWVEADLMRAAAGAGNAALARSMARQVRERCADPGLGAAAARAHLEVARGELQLGALGAAEEAASTALSLARAHREGRTLLMAEALLDAIRRDRATGRPATAARRPVAARPSGPDDGLAAELIRSLRELAPADSTAGGETPESTGNERNELPQPEAPVR